MIGCLLLPHFALRVETMRHAALDGAPLALTSVGQRPEVLECSPEAAEVGVRPGMAAREALALCRELVMVAPDPVLYAQRFEQVLDDLEQVIGPVEPAGLGVAFCDVEALGSEGQKSKFKMQKDAGDPFFTLHSEFC